MAKKNAKKPVPKDEKRQPDSEPSNGNKSSNRQRLVIRIEDGDSDFLRVLPFGLSKPMRSLTVRGQSARKTRLERVVRKLYPFLQKLEGAALGNDQSIIGSMPMADALKNDRAIERCIKVFEVAWQLDLLVIVSPQGKKIGTGKRTAPTGPCGMSVAEAEQIYVDRAVNAIFANNKEALQRLPAEVRSLDTLPRLRILSAMSAVALGELRMRLGARFNAIMTDAISENWLNAVTHLKAFQIRALGETFGPATSEILEWSAQYMYAFTQAFTVQEQIRDLGLELRLLTTPEALDAIASWEVRDVTERVNEELRKRGRKTVETQQYETDISVFRTMLGGDFPTLIRQPAPTIRSFGNLLRNIRQMPAGQPRTDIIEQVKTFCDRYLSYMTADALQALDISTEIEPDDTAGPTIPEIVGIMNGIWGKPGLGRIFFEQHLQRKDGVAALRGLLDDYRDMVKRGSIQRKQDIATIIISSSVLDRAISRYISA